jgi:hypothetical protein
MKAQHFVNEEITSGEWIVEDTRQWLDEVGYGLVRCEGLYPRSLHIRTGIVRGNRTVHAAVYRGKAEVFNPGKRKFVEDWLCFRFVRTAHFGTKICRENRKRIRKD